MGIQIDLGRHLCSLHHVQGNHEDLEAAGHDYAQGAGFLQRPPRKTSRISMQLRGPLALDLGPCDCVDGLECLEYLGEYIDASRGSDRISGECPTYDVSFCDVGDRRVVMKCVQHGPSTKRASVQTRRVDIDSGGHDGYSF